MYHSGSLSSIANGVKQQLKDEHEIGKKSTFAGKISNKKKAQALRTLEEACLEDIIGN